MSKESTELIKEKKESTDEGNYEEYDDYKLHGMALFRHRIALRLESFGELLFETQSPKESILFLLLMSVIGMVALYFIDNDVYSLACDYLGGPVWVIGGYLLLALLYYATWLVSARFRKHLMLDTIPVLFSSTTLFFYVNLKQGLIRPNAAEEYTLIIIGILLFVCIVIGFAEYFISKAVSKHRNKKTYKEMQTAFRRFYENMIDTEPENVSYDEISTMNERYQLGFSEEMMRKACKNDDE